jgi:hypothetical protein
VSGVSGVVGASGYRVLHAAKLEEDVWFFAKVQGDYWRMPSGGLPIDDYMSLPVL